jgi:signal transduction histidine kinase
MAYRYAVLRRLSLRTVIQVLATGAAYYLATQTAWGLTFPDSKVSLFFPPHAVLVSILLLVPTRHWWAYTLAAAGSHFFATQQDHWPVVYALQCEAFDAVKNVLAAGLIRVFIKSPFGRITLRQAVLFVLIAVVIVPFGMAFWGAAFTVSNNFGTHYWIEWRNLGISNGVTAIVLMPVILIGVHQRFAKVFDVAPRRILEAAILAAGVVLVGYVAFDRSPAGPDTSPALLYAPVPLLIWATLRFGLGGISASMLVVTVLAIWGTMQGRGPFLTQSPSENAVALQLFILMLATPLMLLAVAIDDERRSSAEAQVQREELAHLSRVASLSALSGSLAHELGQPLGSILGNAQAGQRLMSQDLPDLAEVRAIFADIVGANRRAAEIIERLRTMMRRGEVVLQPVSVTESLEELLRLTRSDLIARGVSVSNLATGDVPLAMTDRVQLQQVLLNLIVNACDAMKSNRPEDRNLTLTTAVAPTEVVIGVLDTGVGLPEDIDTLFRPFHTTKADGLGMGLSICRTLVTSHGERLWAERGAARGAAFYVALPLARQDV